VDVAQLDVTKRVSVVTGNRLFGGIQAPGPQLWRLKIGQADLETEVGRFIGLQEGKPMVRFFQSFDPLQASFQITFRFALPFVSDAPADIAILIVE